MAQSDVVEQLLKSNLELTRQVIDLAAEVVRGNRVDAVATQTVAIPPAPQYRPPTFDEFLHEDQNSLSPQERLFWSEEEEDAAYTAEVYGDGKSPAELSEVKEILKAAGLEPAVEVQP